MRIVFIDDNTAFRESLTEILEEEGHEVFAFDNPNVCPLNETPHCRCQENEVCTDVILTDLTMPAISGLEFIRTQKNKLCKCQQIALISASFTEDDFEAAEKIGCVIFPKPLDFRKFIEWMDSTEIRPDRLLRDWFKQPITN